jgi:hypothetical protein
VRSISKWALVAAAALLASLSPVAAADGRPLVHGFSVDAGLGYDTNPYLAPDKPYFDQNGERTITPVKQPGFYFPLRLRGTLEMPLGGGHSFLTDYRALGDLYGEEATRNADEAYLKVEPGFLVNLAADSSKRRTMDVRGYASYNRDLYFDRDTGIPVTTEGVDVSDRFTYRAIGGELAFDIELARNVGYYIEGRAERRNYEETDVVDAFDHDRVRAETGFAFEFSRKVELLVYYRYEIRDYRFRHARSLDGEDYEENPFLRYSLDGGSTSLRLRPWRPWTLDLIYERVNRDDEHLHYNDYTQDTHRIRSRLRFPRVEWRLTGKYWERDFERAFIFDNEINPETGEVNFVKFYETYDLTSELFFPLKRRYGLLAAFEYRDQRTADPRFDYDRMQVMTGVRFVY